MLRKVGWRLSAPLLFYLASTSHNCNGMQWTAVSNTQNVKTYMCFISWINMCRYVQPLPLSHAVPVTTCVHIMTFCYVTHLPCHSMRSLHRNPHRILCTPTIRSSLLPLGKHKTFLHVPTVLNRALGWRALTPLASPSLHKRLRIVVRARLGQQHKCTGTDKPPMTIRTRARLLAPTPMTMSVSGFWLGGGTFS